MGRWLLNRPPLALASLVAVFGLLMVVVAATAVRALFSLGVPLSGAASVVLGLAAAVMGGIAGWAGFVRRDLILGVCAYAWFGIFVFAAGPASGPAGEWVPLSPHVVKNSSQSSATGSSAQECSR
jgi:hypothetical protein